MIVPRLCCCCGGFVDSIIPVFVQLHRSGFNLEFETSYESIRYVVVDLQQRNGNISGCFEHFNCSKAMSNQVIFQGNGPGGIFANYFKGLAAFYVHKRALSIFKKMW